MAESVDLPYGHSGPPVYDSAAREWKFERLVDVSERLLILSGPKLIKASGNICGQDDIDEHHPGAPSIRHPKQIQDVALAFPTLCPSAASLREYISVSEAVDSATKVHDGIFGHLISFGRISDKKSRKTLHVVAIPHGPCGSNLCLLKVQTVRTGWSDSRANHLRIHRFGGQEATWVGPGAPIEQVCFSHPRTKSDVFLAIRLPVGTVIFRPIYQQSRKIGQQNLRLNPVTEIRAFELQDITFNPFYTNQIAFIDRKARWKVHEMEWHRGADDKMYNSKAVCSGAVLPDGAHSEHIEDGWTRIRWLGSPTIICTCSRYHLSCHDISSSMPLFLNQLDFASPICDITQPVDELDMIIVLTTTHVRIYRARHHRDRLTLRLTLELRHYRNDEDATLRLSVLTEDDVLRIMIRSDLNRSLDVFRVKVTEGRCYIIADPYRMPLPLNLKPADFYLMNTEYRIQAPGDGHASRCQASGLTFYDAVFFDHESGLHHVLYAAIPPNSTIQAPPTTWTSSLQFSRSAVGVDEFVFDESDDDDNNATPTWRKFDWQHIRDRNISRLDWKVSLEHIANQVGRLPSNWDSTIDRIADRVENVLTNNSTGVTHLTTLAEIATGDVLLNDVEAAASRLQSLLTYQPEMSAEDETSADHAVTRLVVQTLPLPRLPGLEAFENNRTLPSLYDSMIDDWISPLPAEVPGRTRVAYERLVRRAAVDLTLASHVLCPTSEDADTQPEQQPTPALISTESQWDLPIRAPHVSGPSARSTPSIYHDAASRATTPAPSLMTASTTFSSATDVARLSRYTSFDALPSASSVTTTLPRALHGILAHWTLGSDPDAYDWAAMTRSVERAQNAADDEDEEQGLTPRERERLRRRAERHLRRERREALASQQALMKSSQVVEVASTRPPSTLAAGTVPASSPVRPKTQTTEAGEPDTGFSQDQGLPVVASQVVPGRFGGRPSMGQASKKRKRKSGF